MHFRFYRNSSPLLVLNHGMTLSRWIAYVGAVGGLGLIFGLWDYLDPLAKETGNTFACLFFPSLERCQNLQHVDPIAAWKAAFRYFAWALLFLSVPVLLYCLINGGCRAVLRKYKYSLAILFRYNLPDCGFRPPRTAWPLTFMVVALGLIASIGIVAGSSLLLNHEHGGNTHAIRHLAQASPGFYFLLLAAAVIATPLWEEYLFRGILPAALQRGTPLPGFILAFRNRFSANGLLATPPAPYWLAASISSTLFAAAHLTAAWFVPLLLIGLLLTAIRCLTGSLWPSVAVHSIHNLLVMASTRTIY